mmetsp:Transcript_29857/g.87139  ORF Transcript_29857/g.87139 Transcript_29857/m.87139 type:complete len:330 (-) Transcript_29857:345-1334(-)
MALARLVKVLGTVQLTLNLTQRRIRECHSAFPARLDFGGACQLLLKKIEVGVNEWRAEVGGKLVHRMPAEILVHHVFLDGRHHLCHLRNCLGIADVDATQFLGRLGSSREVRGEVEGTAAPLRQLSDGHGVVRGVRVPVLRLGHVRLGKLHFEVVDGFGGLGALGRGFRRLGIVEEGEHQRHVRLVRHSLILLVVVEVVVPIGQTQSALIHLAEAVVGILVVGRCADGKEGRHAALGHEPADGCGQEGISTGSTGGGGAGSIGSRGTQIQQRPEGRRSRHLDRGLVHGGGVEAGDLGLVGAQRRLPLGLLGLEVLQHGLETLLRLDVQH